MVILCKNVSTAESGPVYFLFIYFQKPNCTTDSVNNCKYISEIYRKANPGNEQKNVSSSWLNDVNIKSD